MNSSLVLVAELAPQRAPQRCGGELASNATTRCDNDPPSPLTLTLPRLGQGPGRTLCGEARRSRRHLCAQSPLTDSLLTGGA
jgi:hypothetical protein